MSTEAELDAAIDESMTRDVWFFKHSTRCGVSDAALREFEVFVAERQAAGETGFHLIEVPENRPVSSALSGRVQVRHQSPQAILVREGSAVWHASHWEITRGELSKVE